MKIPDGDIEFKVNGEWKSYCISDGETKESIEKMNNVTWRFPVGTECRYIYHGKIMEFKIETLGEKQEIKYQKPRMKIKRRK